MAKFIYTVMGVTSGQQSHQSVLSWIAVKVAWQCFGARDKGVGSC